MESHAPPGAIQVTERTQRRLEDGFVLERRTGVVVKGKGEMTTYVLLSERPERSVAAMRYEPASSHNEIAGFRLRPQTASLGTGQQTGSKRFKSTPRNHAQSDREKPKGAHE